MKEPQTSNDNEIVETLSHKYSYEDFVRMQKNTENISIASEDIEKAKKDRIIITKDTPNPFGKRILIEVIALVAVMTISVVLYGIFENRKIVEYVSGIGIGLVAMELGPTIIKYFRFNKLKKNS